MKKNTDPKIIVLDASVFQDLVYMATCGKHDGCDGDLSGVLRHARKFNTPYGEAHRRTLKAEKDRIEKARVKAIALWRELRSKPDVFVKHGDDTWLPYKVLGLTADKTQLRVIFTGFVPQPKGWFERAISPSRAREIHLPPEHIHRQPPDTSLSDGLDDPI